VASVRNGTQYGLIPKGSPTTFKLEQSHGFELRFIQNCHGNSRQVLIETNWPSLTSFSLSRTHGNRWNK
jgi:hypothetical protein